MCAQTYMHSLLFALDPEQALLKKSKMYVVSNEVIPESVDNQWQSARIIELQPWQ